MSRPWFLGGVRPLAAGFSRWFNCEFNNIPRYMVKMPKPMKNSTTRHQFILKNLQENGRVMIEDLSVATGVSGVTIRKDLKILENKGLLFRTRGGGSINNPYTIERPINEKEFIHAREKDLIAKAALSLIGENDSIMIGSGTTVFSF